MNKSHISKTIALLFVLFITVGAAAPAVFNGEMISSIQLVDIHQPADTDFLVTVRTYNDQMAFNDDDFDFVVRNDTASGNPALNNAWVRLYNITTQALLYQGFTDGNGLVTFANLPIGTYQWNVSHPLASGTPDATGEIVSNGPEANVNVHFGNIDFENDQDDLNVTITDIEGELAYNLNFSIMFLDNSSIWAQTEVTTGVVTYLDIPDEDYYWELRVLGDPVYDGYLLETGAFQANGTQLLAYQRIGPLLGDPDYFDLEIFTYYETSLAPIVGANATVMFSNGTVYASKLSPANGTVLFIDLPVEFINWTITYGGQPVGDGDYFRDLTDVSADVRDPVITPVLDQEYLISEENVTITWHVEDDYPDSLTVYVDGKQNFTTAWTNTTYDFIYNVSQYFSEFAIGEYEVTLVASDQNLNTAEDTILVRIYENVTPVIDNPDPVEFFFSETGYTLSWNVSDEYPDKYNITRNGENFDSGIIDPDEPVITINLNDLEIGVHNFTLYANDTSGNIASAWVLVTVNGDTTNPVIVYAPDTIVYAQGDSYPIQNWTVTDDFMDYYTISIDGVVFVSEDWTSDTIEFDFSGLQVGSHNVTLTVYDIGGNSVSSVVSVLVTISTAQRYLTAIAIGAAAIIGLIVVVWFVRFR